MKQALKCDFTWADFKTNSDGMVPVVVQDAENDEVLMLAYMNEEAFETTLRLGKMTYWSRSRNELWTKGLSSGHMRFCIVKSHYRRRYFKINRTARMYMITLIFFSFAFPLRIWIAT